MRVSRGQLPGRPTPCPKPCVYSVNGVCDEPQINKGNGDAYCHRISNKHVLAWLRPEGKNAPRIICTPENEEAARRFAGDCMEVSVHGKPENQR